MGLIVTGGILLIIFALIFKDIGKENIEKDDHINDFEL